MSEGGATIISMAEAALRLPDPLEAHVAALAKAAAILEWPLPRERDEATCHEMARIIDALFVRVARGRGVLDVAIGEALDALGGGARSLKVGYSTSEITPAKSLASPRAPRRRWRGSRGRCGSGRACVPPFAPARCPFALPRPFCPRRRARTRRPGWSGRARSRFARSRPR